MRAAHHRRDRFQIADQFAARSRRGLLPGLPLRFEKQRRIVQNAFAGRRRSPPPSGVELAGLARIAMMFGEDRRHPPAVLQALPPRRHQEFHRRLRPDFAFAHLLLDGLRQQFHQRQPPRYPAHAAVEPPRQLFQPVAEAVCHLRQQPSHFQRRLMFAQAQRTVQQYGGRFAHRPHHRFHRVPAQLFQRRHPLIAIDDYVAVRLAFRRHHHDGHLLPAFGQRRQQPPLPRRPAHSQMLPAPLELMKLQLHRQAECKPVSPADQYLRIKCAPASSAAPAAGRNPAPAGTPRNRSAAKGFAAAAQNARSTPAGRMGARKKCS